MIPADPFAWTLDPRVTVPLLLLAVVYGRGLVRLAAAGPRGRRQRRQQALLFWSGWTVLAIALVTPLHALGGRVFAAHMAGHELLMVLAAPLLVAARPGGVLLMGLPTLLRRAGVAVAQHGRGLWRAVREPWTAALLHAGAIWIWHAPGPFLAALADPTLHVLQHASFFGSALLLWSAARRPQQRPSAIGALFATSLQAGALGALLTFSPRAWYPSAPDPASICGLSRIEDQQLAGLIMWIPACTIYALGALALAGTLLRRPEPRRGSSPTAMPGLGLADRGARDASGYFLTLD
jgi:putative membrane protein